MSTDFRIRIVALGLLLVASALFLWRTVSGEFVGDLLNGMGCGILLGAVIFPKE